MIQSSDVTLTFEEIVAASRCRRDWLLELIAEDIISIDGVPEKSTSVVSSCPHPSRTTLKP